MTLVFLICGYQIRQLFNNWMENNITSTVDESYNYMSLRDVPFPAITICSDIQLQNIEKHTITNQSIYKY